jgi:hypothetical protein
MLPEVREHALYEVRDLANLELDGSIGAIRSDRPAVPSSLDLVEWLSSVCVLADRKARSNLPTESMSRARLERYAETAFAIDEARDVRCDIHVEGRRFIARRCDKPSRDLNS